MRLKGWQKSIMRRYCFYVRVRIFFLTKYVGGTGGHVVGSMGTILEGIQI